MNFPTAMRFAHNEKENMETVELAKEFLGHGVVGGLAGAAASIAAVVSAAAGQQGQRQGGGQQQREQFAGLH